jgi:hypothetical protein
VYPFLRAWETLGISEKGALEFGGDLHLYLNLINVKNLENGIIRNPWYHTEVPRGEIAFYRFPLALEAFRCLKDLTGNNVAVVLWTALWVGLACLSVVWLFWRVLQVRKVFLIGAVLVVFHLWNLSDLKKIMDAWLYFPSFNGLYLPYMRTFFPLSVIAPIVAYIGLQIRALKTESWINWTLLVLIQFAALAAFPYATLLMALISGFTLIMLALEGKAQHGWKWMVGFGVICTLMDGVYLYAMKPKASYLREQSIMNVDFSRLSYLLGGTIGLIVILSLVILFLRDQGFTEAKVTFVALGIGCSVLLAGDIFIDPRLQVSLHGNYFSHMTLALLGGYLSIRCSDALAWRYPVSRWALGGFIAVVLFHGLMVSNATYNRFKEYNRLQEELAKIIGSLNLCDRDLVICPAEAGTDVGAWLSLIAEAQVMFSFKSDYFLAEKDVEEIHRYRQALYFFMRGRGSEWLEDVIRNGSTRQKEDLLRIIERTDVRRPHFLELLLKIKETLVRSMDRIAQKDPKTIWFFRKFRRVLVIDFIDNPLFKKNRLNVYLRLVSETKAGPYLFGWYEAL